MKNITETIASRKLPPNQNIEKVLKRDVANGLKAASRDTSKGEYRKTRDGFEILEFINPEAVRKSLSYGERFFKVLES